MLVQTKLRILITVSPIESLHKSLLLGWQFAAAQVEWSLIDWPLTRIRPSSKHTKIDFVRYAVSAELSDCRYFSSRARDVRVEPFSTVAACSTRGGYGGHGDVRAPCQAFCPGAVFFLDVFFPSQREGSNPPPTPPPPPPFP